MKFWCDDSISLCRTEKSGTMGRGHTCSPGRKKSAKIVKDCSGKKRCVRYGARGSRIRPSENKSFCARHRCVQKTNPATPGYQSCKAWKCKTGPRCSSVRRRKKGAARTKTRRSRAPAYVSKSGRKYTRCWKGYRRSGWKTKDGRRVPNCVKK